MVNSSIVVIGYLFTRHYFSEASDVIEKVDPAITGYLGGFGFPIAFSWIVGGLAAAGAAWWIGKITLSLRADYLAIATLGIAEIILYVIKNEDWFVRGVKNVAGLPRPVPYEVNLQNSVWFLGYGCLDSISSELGVTPSIRSNSPVKRVCQSIFSRLC